MKTIYNLPVSILCNRRLIEPFETDQGGISCEYYWVTDKDGVFVDSGPMIYIGIENLINLNAKTFEYKLV